MQTHAIQRVKQAADFDAAWPKRTAIVAACVALVMGCATSPLGRSQLQLFSDRDMRAMGEAAFTEIRRDVPAAGAENINAYVGCVTSAIVEQLDRSTIDWEVVVFDDPQVNAFALPGGKIGVYAGLLDVAATQDQLAAVIGHEIGHVQAAHANERLSTNALTQVGMQVVASISGGASPQRDSALAALGLGVQVGVLLPFSRTQEEEADLIGVDLMADAGFDPQESIVLWQNMAQAARGAPPEFLSTHPSSKTRIAALEARLPHAMTVYREAIANGRQPRCQR